MPNEHKELYEFDKFRLDVYERILWRDGDRLPLSEKAFETLCTLVRRPNQLVGKDEILSEVWADAIVEENNLDKNISLLRKVLGEREGKGKFIETVRGHGYRFVAEVRQVGLTPLAPLAEPIDLADTEPQFVIAPIQVQNAAGARRGLASVVLPGLLLLIALASAFYFWRQSRSESGAATSIKTVAVLPFKPLVGENRDEALEMGMADTLISKLSGGSITVRPLSSVRRFVGLEQDSLAAGRELEADAVLDGSIHTLGERIRVSAKLLRTSDGRQLWAEQFDEKFTDIFAVQDSISEKVAGALRIQLANKLKKRQTENVDAFQLYMKGRFHLLKAVKPETGTSISYFQQAIEVDPTYALAYAGLADAFRGSAVGGEMNSAEFMPKAKAAANKAIELDDGLAEAHASLGHIMFWYEWDWAGAEAQHNRALELDPASADALQFYAHLLSNTGRHDEALAKIKKAREIDPLNLRINALEGLYLHHAGKTGEAIASLEKTLELDPNYRLTNVFVARAYTEKGMFAEAISAAERARDISAVSTEPIAYGACALAKSGKTAEARTALDEMHSLATKRYVPPYNFALVYYSLGDEAKALDHLERAFAERDVRMAFLKVEPAWRLLHNHPRFIDLMRRMNL